MLTKNVNSSNCRWFWLAETNSCQIAGWDTFATWWVTSEEMTHPCCNHVRDVFIGNASCSMEIVAWKLCPVAVIIFTSFAWVYRFCDGPPGVLVAHLSRLMARITSSPVHGHQRYLAQVVHCSTYKYATCACSCADRVAQRVYADLSEIKMNTTGVYVGEDTTAL